MRLRIPTHSKKSPVPGLFLVLSLLFLFGGFAAARVARADAKDVKLDKLRLPPGFSISVYAEVPGAREMTLGPGGTLFVGTREGNVYAVVDAGDGTKAKEVVRLARDLNEPNGVAFRDGALYVAEVSRVLRFDGIEDRLNDPPKPVVVRDDYPDKKAHGWKFIRFGPDGRLYVPVGAPCNECEVHDPFGTITRLKPDGSAREVYARGIRNTVGFDWDPDTRELWFTDNGRDMLGDDRPPDELNHAPKPGMNFGYPYCHGGDLPDPELNPDGSKHPCSEYTPPALKLGPHHATLGMRFYTGSMFPQEYRHRIFIAEHGSWNSSVPVGYDVITVTLEGNRAVRQDVFIQGWLQGGRPWGRPVDVQELPDGSLLISDDSGDAIYRVHR